MSIKELKVYIHTLYTLWHVYYKTFYNKEIAPNIIPHIKAKAILYILCNPFRKKVNINTVERVREKKQYFS